MRLKKIGKNFVIAAKLLRDHIMILVDTSIWIAFFRKEPAPADELLHEKILKEELCVARLILTELYRGCYTAKDARKIESLFKAITVLPESTETYQKAGLLALDLEKHGFKIGTVDAVIAELAIENNCHLWSLDKHFKAIATHYPDLTLFQS